MKQHCESAPATGRSPNRLKTDPDGSAYPAVCGQMTAHPKVRGPSWRVRDVSGLGTRHGLRPAVRIDHSENNAPPPVRSEGQLSRKSSKRVQTGEPHNFEPITYRNRQARCTRACTKTGYIIRLCPSLSTADTPSIAGSTSSVSRRTRRNISKTATARSG